jgi:hypothetical protein
MQFLEGIVMTTLRYAVLKVGKEWRVVCERRQIGHFPTRAAAVSAGAALAREGVGCGHAVEFMVQSPAGLLVAETFLPPSATAAPDGRAQA